MHQPGGTDTAPSPPTRRRPWRLALALGTAGFAVLFRWVSWGVAHPSVVYDENGYLGNARRFAGGARWQMPVAPAYAIGYPAVLAPFLAVLRTAAAQWQAVLAVNACLLALVFPLLALVLRRVLGFGERAALAGASAGALVPAVVATGPSGIAENLALPALLATILAAWAFARPGPWWQRVWFGPLVVVLYATHARFTSLLVLAVVVVAWVAWVGWRDRGAGGASASAFVAVANAAVLVVGALAVRWVTAAMLRSRWPEVERLEGEPSDWIGILTSGEGLVDTLHEAIGQAWYLAAGSIGIGLVGMAVVVRRLRSGGPAPATTTAAITGPTADDEVRARRTALAFTVAAATVVFGTSVLFFTQNQFRADHMIYGRHNDSFSTLWVATGLAFLVEVASRRKALLALAGAAGAVALLGLALANVRDPGRYGARYSPFAVPGVFRYVGNHPTGTFWKATVGALVALAAIALVVAARDRARAAGARRLAGATLVTLVAGVGLWSLGGGLRAVEGTRNYQTLLYDEWHAPRDLRRLGVRTLEIDGRVAGGFPNLAYAWEMPELDVTTYDPVQGQQPVGPYVLARLEDEARAAAGARVLLLDEGFATEVFDVPEGLAVWVEPGTEQDRLAAEGRLLPAGFPRALPRSARAAEMAVDGPAGTVTIPVGGRVPFRATGTATGTGSPWPDRYSYNRPGRVRAIAEITPLEPGLPTGARSGGELGRWTLPGDRFTIEGEVVAVDRFLAPLPPGRYRVQLGIGQDGEDWFTSGGPDSAFTLVVAEP